MELEGEQQRHAETAKSMRRQERRLKELTSQLEEDRSTHERMHDVIDKLHQKLKLYKRQIDEAVSECVIHEDSINPTCFELQPGRALYVGCLTTIMI